MTALPLAHLDDFTLAALAVGDLPPSMGAEARRHLHACPPCALRFRDIAVEADALADPGVEALEPAGARPAPLQLLEVARPDGGVVLLFPAPAASAAPEAGISRLASRVFGRFEQFLHAAAGVAEPAGALEIAAGEAVHALGGIPGETLEVWFANQHPHEAWLTVLRQSAGGAPVVCDGPRRLQPGRNAGTPTRLSVAGAEEVVLAMLTREEPPPRARLEQALALGAFAVLAAQEPLGQIVCRLVPTR